MEIVQHQSEQILLKQNSTNIVGTYQGTLQICCFRSVNHSMIIGHVNCCINRGTNSLPFQIGCMRERVNGTQPWSIDQGVKAVPNPLRLEIAWNLLHVRLLSFPSRAFTPNHPNHSQVIDAFWSHPESPAPPDHWSYPQRHQYGSTS